MKVQKMKPAAFHSTWYTESVFDDAIWLSPILLCLFNSLGSVCI
jgi:hypothetical protein